MPTNLGHEAISALKVGHESVTAGYVGHEQIFPNTTEITSLAWNNTLDVSQSGGSRNLQVAGALGSTFDITGSSGAGSYSGQILSSPTQSYTISIGSNSPGSCTVNNRTPSIVVTPTGTTQLASGVNGTLSLNQSGGPGITYHSASVSINVTNTNRVVLTAGSNVYWGAGSSWDISWSVTSSRRTNGSFYTLWGGTSSGTRSYSTTGNSTSVSGSFTFTMTYTNGAYALPVLLYVNDAYGCNSTTGSPFGTYYYP